MKMLYEEMSRTRLKIYRLQVSLRLRRKTFIVYSRADVAHLIKNTQKHNNYTDVVHNIAVLGSSTTVGISFLLC